MDEQVNPVATWNDLVMWCALMVLAAVIASVVWFVATPMMLLDQLFQAGARDG